MPPTETTSRSRWARRSSLLLVAAAAVLPLLAGPADAAEPAQLTVTLGDRDAHPVRGGTYTYDASVRNDGTATLRGARLVAVVPTGEVRLLPRSVRTNAGQVTIGNVFGATNNLISIELGALTPGERLTASWTVRVRADLPAGLEAFSAAVTAERTADDGYPDTLAGAYDVETEPATELTATLSGAQVRPGPGDRDGSGSAQLRVVPATGQVCQVVQVRRIALPALRTVLGADGQAPATLPAPDTSGAARGCSTVDPLLTRALVTGEGGFLRVDSPRFPGGALAGALAPASPPA